MLNLKQPGKQPLAILVVTFVILLVLAAIPEGHNVLSYKIKKLDLFMDVRQDETSAPVSARAPVDFTGINQASMFQFDMIFNWLSVLSPMANTPAAVQKIENPGAMKKFYDAVKQSGSKKVRIAHYGDSAIEGDNISADLRKNLQAKFGGNGSGIVGITSQDKQFRTTTDMDWSGDWKTYSLISTNPDKLPLGINGFIFQPASGSWVKMGASGRSSAVKYFTSVRVLYTSDKNVTIKYSFDDKSESSAELKASKSVNEVVLNANAKVKTIKVTVVNPSKTYLYGLSLEEGNGLYIDNFPLRGNSGASLRDLDISTLKDFDRLLGYKLIILNFGLNMLTPEAKDFGWYESAMEKVLNQYKEAFPQASILVVSVGDKSSKKGSQFVTDPIVPKLVEAQKRIAQKAGVAFWNLFEAMGGQNSMSSWVEQGYAEKDYTHMKLTGSKKIADLLSEAINAQ